MSLESTVGVAKVGTKSLRATVPEGIVAFLEIREGDKLEWKMEVQGTERLAIVKKKEQSKTLEDELSKSVKERNKRI